MYLLIRQDVPHQGSGYIKSNLRHFVYVDLKFVTRLPDITRKFYMPSHKLPTVGQLLNSTTLLKSTHIKPMIKKRKNKNKGKK